MKKIAIIFILLFWYCTGYTQLMFSLGTDLALQRNFKEGQKYWALGHAVIGNFHFAPKETAYFMLSYYSNGLVKDQLVATAKSPTTTPQQINFLSQTWMRSQNISIGWKHYFKGNHLTEEGYTIYGSAGFGLLLGRVINQYAVNIDTSLYSVDGPVNGNGNYRRLTLDLGAGVEVPIGNDLFLYSELRTFIPTTDYPTEYLKVNGEAPILGMIGLGIRILFGNY